jgi:hypothetical protein
VTLLKLLSYWDFNGMHPYQGPHNPARAPAQTAWTKLTPVSKGSLFAKKRPPRFRICTGDTSWISLTVLSILPESSEARGPDTLQISEV